ncbi:MAG: hypothetical protein JW850_10660, partial [Thermoflexales bacterium]|nr:hypothetical protein [Thermoflexales bacterium]
MMKKIKVIRLTGIERARLILLLTLLALLAGVVNVLAADAQPVAGQKVQAHNDNEEPDEAHSTTPSSQANRPIIVDHTVVDKYNDIPQEYIDKVKTMWLDVPGESHSGAYRKGCELLEALDSRFQVNVIESGEPEAPTDQHLRVSRAARNASNTNWGYGYGEANWYTNAQAITQTKNHLTYANTHNLEIAAMGFGWCWDMTWINSPTGTVDSVYQVRWAGSSVGGPDGNRAWGLDDGDYALTGNRVNMNTYISATEEYIAHCAANNYPTKVFFTTGPVDGYTGESGYQRYLKHEHIRNYVRASSDRILFDYADILTWGDDGTQNTSQSWIDHSGVLRTFPYIHPDNMRNMDGSTTDDDHDHIGERGALRLAKALWWMLARIAGWDGEAGPQKTVSTETATYSQTITYTIAVRTTNLPPTVTIELSDTLPAGLAYLPGTLIATAGSVDESNAPTLRWSGVLTPAPAITISYAAIVTTTDPQIITNTASIAAAGYQFTPTAGVAILGGSRASDESGNWSAPATWEGDSVPIDGDSVTISSGTTVTVDVDVRCYRLLVEPGAKLVLPEGVTLLVTDRVTNQGTLQQTYAVNNDDIAFLEISDGSGAVRYRGVDVAAAGDLGAVTASIRAMAEGEGCTPAWTEAGAYARRCFEITAQNSTTASLRLWAPADELGGVTTPAVFRYVAPDWVELTNNAIWGTNGDYTYAQADSPGFSHLLMAQSMGAPTPSDVVLQMHFNGNTRDSSVNKFPGTWWGTVAYTSGISGQALDLSAAITNYVMIAQNDRLGGMEQLIVSVWARKNDPDVGGTLVTKAGQYQLVLSNRYVYSYVGNEAGVYGRANSSRLDTVYNTDWHHYVLTYDGALVKLYVDDEQVAEGPLTGTVKLNSMHHLYIGKDPWGGSFDGQIDELVIYNDIPDAHASDESGNWSTPATWEGNVTPGASDIVTISTATTVTVDADTQCHTLTIEPGATLVIPAGVALTVTSGVVNQGRLLQVQAVNNGHAAFLEIGDGGGLVHHRGVEIDTPNDLGTVTVTLRALGNGEYCTTTGGGAPAYARRCFEIETTRAATASLRLWALQSEISPTVITPAIFRHSGDTWVELTDNTAIGIDDDYQYVQADTPGFSHFLIGQSGHAPTAVSQRELGAADRQPPGWLLIGLALAASAAFGFRHLRRRRKRRSERLHRKETAMKKHSAYTVLLGLTLLAALSGRVAARPQRAPVAEEALAVIRQDCTGYGGPYPCYESLSAWQAAYGGIDFGTHPQGDLVAADKIAVARIEGVWTQADTTPLNLSGWTTDAEHYVRIYTTSEARHNGTPGSGYRLATTGSRPVTGSVAHFRIEGLELHSLSAGTPIYARPGADIDGEMLFSHNLIRGDGVDSAHGIYLYDYDGVAKIWNNVIYDVGSLGYTAGIQTSRGTTYIYNNTVVDIIAGYAIRSDGVTVVKNNLTEAPNDDFYGVFYPGSDFNASSDDTAPGFHSRQEQTFAFVNRASDDFHLASTDAGARNHGTDLSSDPLIPITNDIDSDTRSGGWDVGADEATSGTDTVPPIRFDGAPSGTLPSDTTEVTLTLSTNEAATCRYATTPGVAYGSMTETFSLTGGITHTQSVSGLVDEQTYRYYVRCQDLASSINGDDYEISFYVFSSDRVPPVVSNVQAVDVTP